MKGPAWQLIREERKRGVSRAVILSVRYFSLDHDQLRCLLSISSHLPALLIRKAGLVYLYTTYIYLLTYYITAQV